MSKVFIEESTLIAIGDSIRSKGGTTALITPLDMPAAITNLPSGGGGGGDLEIPTVTGDCSQMAKQNKWNWVIEAFGNRMSTSEITNGEKMFYGCDELIQVPFNINFTTTSRASADNLFTDCSQLVRAPYITGNITAKSGMFRNCTALESIDIGGMRFDSNGYVSASPSRMFQDCGGLKNITGKFKGVVTTCYGIFDSCYSLRDIPEDIFDELDYIRYNSDGAGSYGYIFRKCYSLRKIPSSFNTFIHKTPISGATTNSAFPYYNFIKGCYALDEYTNIPVIEKIGTTNNVFVEAFSECMRLKNVIFETNADGSVKTAEWNRQSIDLSRVGYGEVGYEGLLYGFTSGITEAKRVTDGGWNGSNGTYDSYEALKNDPDWFTLDRNFSRYNLDSAIATINSLPDCSAYGTNTIKFDQYAGLHTTAEANGLPHQGKIGNLTEAQIAVAAAKGWTVSLV
jgi:hypothetical protein